MDCDRLSGTVVGVEQADPKRWPASKWRCLKVLAYSLLEPVIIILL